ncbi:MAG: hypothetical protein JW860_09765 [Sedimentisphaerales bacterium]|nr:hypothetical protein [Sedimentisphaerales bacterium]
MSLTIVLVAILLTVPKEHKLGALLAFINCIIGSVAIYKMVCKQSLGCLIPAIFLGWKILGWCVAPIYFAIFMPDAGYGIFTWTPYLAKDVKVQIIVLSFLIPYLLIIFMMMRHQVSYAPTSLQTARRTNLLVIIIFSVGTILYIATGRFVAEQQSYIDTVFKYTEWLPIVLGIQFTYMSRKIKIICLIIFIIRIAFFTLLNRRALAVMPVISLLTGLLLLSQMSRKTKMVIITSLLVVFPAYMVIGNTVRIVAGSLSGDIQYGLHAMKQWKYIAQESPWAASTFGRLFFNGGHSILSRTPEEVPFVDFSPKQYLKEGVVVFLPSKFTGALQQQYYLEGIYAGNALLYSYGYQLRREYQVGVSILGHFWSLGGYPYIIIGGILVALLQGVIIFLINRATVRNPEKAVFCLALVLSPVFWMAGRGFIVSVRNLIWYYIFGIVFYYVFIHFFVNQDQAYVKSSSYLPGQEVDYTYNNPEEYSLP